VMAWPDFAIPPAVQRQDLYHIESSVILRTSGGID